MKKFSRKTIPLSDILVNPKNPRFDPVSNQTQAIQKMLTEKELEIKNLAEDIMEKGSNPSKNLIMLQKNDKFLTMEGNRRIVCLKLLNNPRLSGNQELREFFHQLKEDYSGKVQDSIHCVVFEKEEDARHWILLEHTGKNQGVGVDSWDREQQHRFSGSASKAVQIFDFADSNNINRQNVDTSNLERILTPYGCGAIGISFSDGILHFDKSKIKVQENIDTVFEKMSKPSFGVKEIYNKEIIEQWFNDTLGIHENAKSTTKNTSSTSKEPPKKATKKTTKSTRRKHLIPKDCHLEIAPSKIRNIFIELRDDLVLDGQKATPNAVGVLFRVFLEVSIKYYLDKKQIPYTFNTKLKEKINKVTAHMVNNTTATNDDVKYMRNTAQRTSSNILTVDSFHDYVHSNHIRPIPGDLKAYWENTQTFFEILWANV